MSQFAWIPTRSRIFPQCCPAIASTGIIVMLSLAYQDAYRGRLLGVT